MSGTGKTTTVRSILNNHFRDLSVYVNCWNNKTTHKIMEEILKQMGVIIHGWESTNVLIKIFEKAKRKVIVCLDESDHLKDKDLLYTFARSGCPVILISNHSYSPHKMDGRIKSSLHLQEIEFRNYQPEEVRDILKDRIISGLTPKSITDEMIAEIANSCGGDARAGIQILKNAAVSSESKGLESITLDEIKTAASYARKYRLSYLIGKLNEHQKTIYEILRQNRVMDSGSLFNEYRKVVNGTITDRSYRNYMLRMVELGLVREIGASRWKKYEITV
jgi:Cdc6-like AAA superfamily ATPase